MKLETNINVHHLSRVEGHGNIRIKVKGGKLVSAQWEVVETPRFFEAILQGKHWESAPVITGRICGICSIGHTLASIRAIENAFGYEPSLQTRRLRLLLKHMETLQSHVLHICFLVLPDLLGVTSVLPLIQSHPEVVELAASLKLLANDACDLVGGRRLHPTTTIVGGFTMLPDKQSLENIGHRLKEAVKGLGQLASLIGSLKLPDFTRETEFVSLSANDHYPFIGGELVSSDGVRKKENDYRAMTNEFMVSQSTSKWCKLSRDSFAVGALARVNNNYGQLHPEAKGVASSLGLHPVCHNPFMNNVAQLVECVHAVHDSIRLVESYLCTDEEPASEKVTPRKGHGVSAVEVPRGILYHSYRIDKSGRITEADCVIPTGQNHANIQHDMKALVALNAPDMDDGELELLASMLVRAYDPCISCSVH